MRDEPAYQHGGLTSRTLIRTDDMRVVFLVLKTGREMQKHQVDETACVHVLSGTVTMRLPDRAVELSKGELLVMERGLAHDVVASEDSTLLITFGWDASR
ncbi:MAG: cupin domain-containing protein [Myxococcales bacterium]|nr:cupin domain-containing protein [Myxococcales bacterium]